MAKVGDKVTLKVKGAPGTGTSLGLNNGGIKVSPGNSLTLNGKIVEDQGENWVVELNVSFGSKNTVLVSKQATAA